MMPAAVATIGAGRGAAPDRGRCPVPGPGVHRVQRVTLPFVVPAILLIVIGAPRVRDTPRRATVGAVLVIVLGVAAWSPHSRRPRRRAGSPAPARTARRSTRRSRPVADSVVGAATSIGLQPTDVASGCDGGAFTDPGPPCRRPRHRRGGGGRAGIDAAAHAPGATPRVRPVMTKFRLETLIEAPIDVVFDLARDIGLHARSMAPTDEHAVAGRTSGRIEQGETVTWRARHFGLWWRLTSRITECTPRPPSPINRKVARSRGSATNTFRSAPGGTGMADDWQHAAPFGPLGRLVDRLVLGRYMRRLLETRNRVLKAEAERGAPQGRLAAGPTPSTAPNSGGGRVDGDLARGDPLGPPGRAELKIVSWPSKAVGHSPVNGRPLMTAKSVVAIAASRVLSTSGVTLPSSFGGLAASGLVRLARRDRPTARAVMHSPPRVSTVTSGRAGAAALAAAGPARPQAEHERDNHEDANAGLAWLPDGPRSPGSRLSSAMAVLRSRLDPAAAETRANHEAMAALVEELRARQAAVAGRGAGGDERSIERHRERGKLPVRERIDRLLDPGSAFLELQPARRDRPVRRRCARGRDRHRHRPGRGHDLRDRRQRRDGQGRHLLPDDRQEAPAGPGDRAREPAAVHLPGRLGRRVPAAPGRGLPRPRPLRPDLLQPGADVGRRDPAGRAGHGLVHGRRRVRAGDERRDRDRPRHRARSSSAGRRW